MMREKERQWFKMDCLCLFLSLKKTPKQLSWLPKSRTNIYNEMLRLGLKLADWANTKRDFSTDFAFWKMGLEH